ncbi:gfo/Idh/MocA family oxidoreductase [Paludibacter sp. 221]|uniref:Gfo/Idh/MocA family protein n=1 Tax=Paludibacter sp. 221 TaxID=2302939 RepID=UPI0013D7F307|nr:Gfo/Idh/MocA family oxidoreductase [Paludibacter sp. 221]NDV46608.1 gfo/Idh/MocA family oxidoreductase [Paludibacter sp. 221]
MKKIRTAFIGLGYRGASLLKLVDKIDAYHVVAIAEPNPLALSNLKHCLSDDAPLLEIYSDGEEAYVDMLENEKVDLVFISSPWQFHYAQATEALSAGCNVALEVKGSLFEGEYQRLQQLAERNRLKIYPLENTVFMRNVMAIGRMVEEDVFGEIIFAQGGYRHDIRDVLIDEKGEYKLPWRAAYYETENADIYPTHSVAPLCLMLKINRGNSFKSLTSFATKSVGLKTRMSDLKSSVPNYALGDVVTTVIGTLTGAQITLFHDTTLPRPRSLSYEIQGTRGAWNDDLKSIYLEGISPYEQWEPEAKYVERYEHPFWAKWGREALVYDEHHQGMDYIMLVALVADFVGEEVYPINIADLATWGDISLLSKKSIAERRTLDL